MNTFSTNILPVRNDPGAGLTNPADSLEGVIDAYMVYLRGRGRKDATLKSYRKALVRFFSWKASTAPDQAVTSDLLVAYRESLAKLCVASANLNVTAVKRFFRWTSIKGIYPDVASGLDGYRLAKGFRKAPLTIEQQQALLDAAKGRVERDGTLWALRDYAIINTLLLCGLRSIEISRAHVCDIRTMYGEKVLMVWGKGHDYPDSPVVLTGEAAAPIDAYLSARGVESPDEPLFRSEGKGSRGGALSPRRIQAVVKELLRSIGLDSHEYSAHSLRHTTGTTLLELGASLSDVQHILRHKDEKTTHIYVDMKYDEMMIRNSPQHLLDNVFKR